MSQPPKCDASYATAPRFIAFWTLAVCAKIPDPGALATLPVYGIICEEELRGTFLGDAVRSVTSHVDAQLALCETGNISLSDEFGEMSMLTGDEDESALEEKFLSAACAFSLWPSKRGMVEAKDEAGEPVVASPNVTGVACWSVVLVDRVLLHGKPDSCAVVAGLLTDSLSDPSKLYATSLRGATLGASESVQTRNLRESELRVQNHALAPCSVLLCRHGICPPRIVH